MSCNNLNPFRKENQPNYQDSRGLGNTGYWFGLEGFNGGVWQLIWKALTEPSPGLVKTFLPGFYFFPRGLGLGLVTWEELNWLVLLSGRTWGRQF